jgi:hypothetical protein
LAFPSYNSPLLDQCLTAHTGIPFLRINQAAFLEAISRLKYLIGTMKGLLLHCCGSDFLHFPLISIFLSFPCLTSSAHEPNGPFEVQKKTARVGIRLLGPADCLSCRKYQAISNRFRKCPKQFAFLLFNPAQLTKNL